MRHTFPQFAASQLAGEHRASKGLGRVYIKETWSKAATRNVSKAVILQRWNLPCNVQYHSHNQIFGKGHERSWEIFSQGPERQRLCMLRLIAQIWSFLIGYSNYMFKCGSSSTWSSWSDLHDQLNITVTHRTLINQVNMMEASLYSAVLDIYFETLQKYDTSPIQCQNEFTWIRFQSIRIIVTCAVHIDKTADSPCS